MDSLNELLPIKFQEHLQVAEQNQVVVIDLNDPENVMRRPITADSAIMNPDSKVIALKAGRQVQIFDLEKKAKLKSYVMTEEVLFWRWLGPSTIGLVSETCVYHWDLEGGNDPRKVFERHTSLAGCQIISYRTDSTGRWLLLVGIIAQHGRVVGAMQLYNMDRGVSQAIEGHTGGFAEVMLEGAQYPTKLFVFAVRTQTAAKLHLVEIDHREGNPVFSKKALDISFPPEAASDFPVSMQIGTKFDVVYVVTKFGFIQIFDLITGACIFANRISSETVFVTTEWRNNSGVIGVNRRGQVLSVMIDGETIVPYLLQNNQPDLAIRMAYNNDLPGADELFANRFTQLINMGDFVEAGKLAARSPRGMLRTPQTIETLKSVAVSPGQSSPLLQYFSILLEKGSLNHHESIELAKPVLSQNKKALLEKWLKENKLECSEELGDIVKPFDTTLALSIYLRADVPEKVCQCFAELGQFSKLVLFAKKVGIQPDYPSLLEAAMAADPVKAVEFGKLILEDASLAVNVEMVFDLFVGHGLVQQATSSVLDRLKQNTDDLASLQTKVLRFSIQQAPQALEHYRNTSDVTRVLLNAPSEINIDWTVSYLQNFATEDIVTILRTLMAQDPAKFVQLVITTGVKLASKVSPAFLMEIFEDAGNYDGLFVFTGALLATCKDAKVHFAYIKSAARTGHYKELEKVCKESSSYDPETVWTFLKEEQGLPDQLPLVIVADRFNLVHDLVVHLFQQNMPKYIEVYVQKVNPSRTPDVVAALFDCGCDSATMQSLLSSVPPRFPLENLVKVLEERDQLPVLLPFLEQKIRQENTRDVAVYNALAKIYIVTKQNAAEFLTENNLYSPAAVGKFCEKREPHLALIAYEKGKLDKELITMTNESAMFKEQAKYLLKRRDMNLWRMVLDKSNAHRDELLDQVINSAVLESQDADDVSIAVKALIGADLAKELLAVLEKLLYGGTSFSSNKNLQNLLLLTAIKTRPDSVMDHMKKLTNFDGSEIAKTCTQAGLFEEALFGYKKGGNLAMAVTILVEFIKDFDRALGFAEDCNDKEVWSKLGRGLCAGGRISQAIDAYIRADDCTDYVEIIKAASSGRHFDDLLRYLQMARRKTRDSALENELLFCLASLNRIADIEEFMQRPHGAQIQMVADRCYQAKLFESAKIFYSSISNYARLATTLVHLHDYNSAVECAKRANSLRVWADVNQACLETGEYHLAQVCGLYLVVHPDELDNIVYSYESRGMHEQCMSLLESSLGLERAHGGIFTELAVQYARHKPSKLLEYLKLYSGKVNMQKVILACQEGHFWGEMAHLLIHHDENERAVSIMIEHPDAWEHERMCRAIQKVSSPETVLRAVKFYLEQSPLQVNELLILVGTRMEPTRIVELFRQSNLLPLIKGYLVAVQPGNSLVVNNALNELLLDEEDLEGLRTSIAKSDKFDLAAFAHRLETHELIDFRRLGAHLYRQNKMWKEAVAVLVKEGLFKDAIALAAESRERAVAEDLLKLLGSAGLVQLFLGCAYACADSIVPDVVLECAWRNGWMDIAIPIMCQSLREYQEKIDPRGDTSRSGSRLGFAPF
ncbi:Clathrin heavy chain [Paramicrosporidium saccamoebae]|uniref:Clathrin heavy chain n=1 Tax=Paramicrosporidium saccamoebae TaxID=1246581 RepID=A0A2H9TFW3_9FUNG|nr:Clathrin heavy chain [Paramicrosporidium saccamoebae]